MLIFAGIGISAVAFLLAGWLGTSPANLGNLLNFVDFPSFMCLYVPIVLFLGFGKNGKILGGYIKSSLKKGYRFSNAELKAIAAAAKSTGHFAIGTGAFFFLSGTVTSIANMNLQEAFAGTLLVEVTVASLVLIYAIAAVFFILYPLQVWATNQLAENNEQEKAL